MPAIQLRLIPSDGVQFQRNNFDFIRLMMALLVIYSHAFALYSGSEDRETLSLITNGFYNSGRIAVWSFFIASGFLVSRSFERSASVRQYASKRMRRVYPGYLVATTICAFVVTPLFIVGRQFAPDISEVARTIALNLFFSNHFPIDDLFLNNLSSTVNGSLWSIKYEVLCYAGIALLGWAGLLRRRAAILILYVAIVFAWCWLDATGRKPGGSQFVRDMVGWPYQWFRVLPNFLAGVLIYLYRERIPRSTPLLMVGLIASFAAFWSPYHLQGLILAHLIAPPTLAYGIFVFAFHPKIALHAAARFGDFSYGTYLYGFVIQQMLLATFQLGFWPFVLLSMLCALLAGAASWCLVERHFLRRKPESVAPCSDPVSFAPGDTAEIYRQFPQHVERDTQQRRGPDLVAGMSPDCADQ
ncbi:Peptidoglycan/LPS O-acetylase OafA/YrhL, contains acyltransferase and SGNH-hydrolase domains [Sphingomonas sp. YR710]|nr:acyltransferase [Sphingomonas sp. YR710]SDD44293.1 Peptidoglycan/LPS O-acetylase OafA/YrhL, contains acyltransferase and SGNH-hydrolase domains [Sphingomonas sp. YR710]